ncbi:MAG: 8-amino-7-oxononanoate synthase [Wenzhouxiangellaceae bacterium]
MTLDQRIRQAREQRQAADLWRQPVTWRSLEGQRLNADGRELIDFSANDYLGLSRHPEVIEAFTLTAQRQGIGSRASRLVSGSHPEHQAVEEALAEWLGYPAALFFASGYLANLALVDGLLQRGDTVVCDRLNHASLIDAARISRAHSRRYPHADVAAAARQLAHAGDQGVRMLLTDGVFSMDGDVAPLAALAATARQHHAVLAVDDAHGIGVWGDQGRGSVAALALTAEQVPLLVGTAGKALGAQGAFICGPRDWIEHLHQRARSWIYTTAPPPAIAAAVTAAIRVVREQPQWQQRLQQRISQWRQGLSQLGLPLSQSHSAIQPLIVGASGAAISLSKALARQGFWVVAMREPTVPAGSARLRITLSAAHAPEDVERLLETLAQLWPRYANE